MTQFVGRSDAGVKSLPRKESGAQAYPTSFTSSVTEFPHPTKDRGVMFQENTPKKAEITSTAIF